MLLIVVQQCCYLRYLLIFEVGMEGQRWLLDSKVLFIGVGGFGSLIVLYLVVLGVGIIGFVDDDVVDESNF